MNAPRNASLQKKSSARLAAVQCLYKAAMTGELMHPAKLIADYAAHLTESKEEGDKEWIPKIEPHSGYMHRLVEGACGHVQAIDATLDGLMKEGSSKDRLSPLMIAILRVAAYEITYETTPARTAIDEYVSITAGFFSETEFGFVNAVLDKLAQNARPLA